VSSVFSEVSCLKAQIWSLVVRTGGPPLQRPCDGNIAGAAMCFSSQRIPVGSRIPSLKRTLCQ
jgi:hypothetical protein